jgi:ubiquinone/menaquinone biosynthesis C-methylase UbiE
MTESALFWDGIAEKYAQKPVANPEAFERKIAVTRARIRQDHVILDIGCGTGSLALRLAPSAAHVHGLDVSGAMIRIARDKAQKQQVQNTTFHVGAFDESFQALSPGSLDGICAYSLLHLVEDRTKTLARIFAMLKPGGFFVSSTPCLGESWLPYRPLLALMRALGKAPPVQIFARSTLAAEVQSAGFVALEQPDVGAERTIAFLVAVKPDRG